MTIHRHLYSDFLPFQSQVKEKVAMKDKRIHYGAKDKC